MRKLVVKRLVSTSYLYEENRLRINLHLLITKHDLKKDDIYELFTNKTINKEYKYQTVTYNIDHYRYVIFILIIRKN